MNIQEAERILELTAPYTTAEAQKRYKELVRKWHPDRASTPELKEEAQARLIQINQAWTVVRNWLAMGTTDGRPDRPSSAATRPTPNPTSNPASSFTAPPNGQPPRATSAYDRTTAAPNADYFTNPTQTASPSSTGSTASTSKRDSSPTSSAEHADETPPDKWYTYHGASERGRKIAKVIRYFPLGIVLLLIALFGFMSTIVANPIGAYFFGETPQMRYEGLDQMQELWLFVQMMLWDVAVLVAFANLFGRWITNRLKYLLIKLTERIWH